MFPHVTQDNSTLPISFYKLMDWLDETEQNLLKVVGSQILQLPKTAPAGDKITCDKCGKANHATADCRKGTPKPVVCHYCSEPDHIERFCKKKKADNQADQTSTGQTSSGQTSTGRSITPAKCSYCGRQGHNESICRTKRYDERQAQATQS